MGSILVAEGWNEARRDWNCEEPIGMTQPVLSALNEEWSLDFVCDALGTGRMVRVLGIVDNFTRECVALEADTSFASQRVTRVLDDVIHLAVFPSLVHRAQDCHASHSARQADAERAGCAMSA